MACNVAALRPTQLKQNFRYTQVQWYQWTMCKLLLVLHPVPVSWCRKHCAHGNKAYNQHANTCTGGSGSTGQFQPQLGELQSYEEGWRQPAKDVCQLPHLNCRALSRWVYRRQMSMAEVHWCARASQDRRHQVRRTRLRLLWAGGAGTLGCSYVLRGRCTTPTPSRCVWSVAAQCWGVCIVGSWAWVMPFMCRSHTWTLGLAAVVISCGCQPSCLGILVVLAVASATQC